MSEPQEMIELIMKHLHDSGIYHLQLKSGKMFAQYGSEAQVVHLCPVGTPQIFAVISGKPIFFQVKKDEKEKVKWHRRVDSFQKTARIPSYIHREIMQYKSMQKIRKSGAEVHLVCSVREVENVIENIYKA